MERKISLFILNIKWVVWNLGRLKWPKNTEGGVLKLLQ